MFPKTLDKIIKILKGTIIGFFAELLLDLALDAFRNKMQKALAKSIVTSYQAGKGRTVLSTQDIKNIAETVATQFGYLDNFVNEMEAYRKELRDNLEPATKPENLTEGEPPPVINESEFLKGFESRAKQYADSVIKPYWQGKVEPLPLPALPGDGTTLCMTHCRCMWDIKPIDAVKGDYDCYWVLGEAEHCQTCTIRAREWAPLKIRNFQLVLPNVVKFSQRKELTDEIVAKIRIKGGPGSGHFGHRGRPGKQGGSLPENETKIYYRDDGISPFSISRNELEELAKLNPHAISLQEAVEPPAYYHEGVYAEYMILNDKDVIRCFGGHDEACSRIIDSGIEKYTDYDYWTPSDSFVIETYDARRIEISRTELSIQTKMISDKTLRRLQGLILDGIIKIENPNVMRIVWEGKYNGFNAWLPDTKVSEFLVANHVFSEKGPVVSLKGGPGSGHFGHRGRPGEQGGSLPAKGGKFLSLVGYVSFDYLEPKDIANIMNKSKDTFTSESEQGMAWLEEHKELYNSERNFRDFSQTVSQYTSGGYSSVRHASAGFVRGDDDPDFYSDSEYNAFDEISFKKTEGYDYKNGIKTLINAIDQTDYIEFDLFRGVPGTSFMPRTNPKVGDILDLKGVTSFSRLKRIAEGFAKGTSAGASSYDSLNSITIFRIAGKKKAINVSPFSPWKQNEWVTQGQFKVVDVIKTQQLWKKRTHAADIYIDRFEIILEHLGTYEV